jgi:hypothetical protein
MTHTFTTSQPPSPAAADLRSAARSFGVTLTVVPSERGAILEGVARTFYGKQMAQELARKANLVVTANRIVVDRTHVG